MKVQDLTKEQIEQIEADVIGKQLLAYHNLPIDNIFHLGFSFIKIGISKIIKQVNDEIEFLNSERIDYFLESTNSKGMFSDRLNYLKEQKELYELMEKLE